MRERAKSVSRGMKLWLAAAAAGLFSIFFFMPASAAGMKPQEASTQILNAVMAANGNVEINEANFPDEAFREYVKTKDRDGNNTLSQNEIDYVKQIDVSNRKEIKDIKGIEFFTELDWLICDGTGITSLDVTKNPKLKDLSCDNTGITSLDVTKNPALDTLYCYYTGITSLDVTENPALKILYCNNTGITSLDVSSNENLEDLSCSSTKISSLDVKKNLKLKKLSCGFTGITKLEVAANKELQELYCGDNTGITSLDVTGLEELIDLDCGFTKIAELNLKTNTKLNSLYCATTNIQGLDISKNIWLEKLDCSGSKALTSLNVSNNTNLKKLVCFGTGITALDVSHNPALTELNCSITGIASLNVAKNVNLQRLECDRTKLTSLDVTKNVNLQRLECDRTKLTELDVSKNLALQYLKCDNTGITGLDVAGNAHLASLECQDTPLAYLNLGVKTIIEEGDAEAGLTVKHFKVPSAASVERPDITGDSFNISTAFPGINPSKIEAVSGGTLNPATGEVSGYGSGGGTIQYTYNCGTNKGAPVQLKVTLKVGKVKGETTFGIPDLEKTYDGKPVELKRSDLVDFKGSTGEMTCIWEKSDGTNWQTLDEAPADVGSYKVTVQIAEDENYNASEASQEFQILEKVLKDRTVEITKTLDKKYDGLAVTLGKSGLKYEGGGDITYKWEDSQAKELSGAPKDVGSYKVTVHVASDGEYKEASTSKDFQIEKGDTAVSITKSLNKPYDGVPVSLEKADLAVSGSSGGFAVTWERKTDSGWETLGEAPSEVGDYRATVSVEADANYEAGRSEPVEFTIREKDLKKRTLKIKKELTKQYDGNAVTLSDSDLEFEGGGEITYKWEKREDSQTEELDGAPSEVGFYTVTVHVSSDGEYEEISEFQVFNIGKGETTVSIEKDLSKPYDGDSVSLEAEDLAISGSSGEPAITWEKKTDSGWERLDDAPFEIGDYRVTVHVAADENFEASREDAVQEFQIRRPGTTVKIVKELDKEYDGDAVTLEESDLEITGSTGEVRFDWQKKGDSGWEGLAGPPSEPGTYRVIAYVDADEDFDGGESEPVEFTIREKAEESSGDGSQGDGAQSGGSMQTGSAAQTGSTSTQAGIAAQAGSAIRAVSAVLTGDSSKLAAAVTALLLSALCILIVVVRRKRRSK